MTETASEHADPSAEATANIRRVLVNAAPPKAAHMLGWTRIGEQVLLEVGYFDLFAINQQIAGRETPPDKLNIDWLITDRFILDLETAERITGTMRELGDELVRMREE